MDVRAEGVSANEVAYAKYSETDNNDSGAGSAQSYIQDNEVLSGDVEDDENNQYDNSPVEDSGQLADMVEMLRYDLLTYINFSYKMQICTVAMLAIIAGGNIAAVIINHFKS